MKKTVLVVLLLALMAAAVVFASNHKYDKQSDHENARELVNNGNILPLEKILETVYQSHQGKVLEVEFEREDNGYIYEIEILDKDNKIWELEVDAVTGKLLKVEEED